MADPPKSLEYVKQAPQGVCSFARFSGIWDLRILGQGGVGVGAPPP